MNTLVRGCLLGGLALALQVPVATDAAQARDRQSTVNTQHGTFTGQTSADCAGGTCSRERSVTGPNGKTATKSGTASKTGEGSYSFQSQATGPNGKSVTRSGTRTVTPSP